jgi:phosphatidylglycerophosphate synthase
MPDSTPGTPLRQAMWITRIRLADVLTGSRIVAAPVVIWLIASDEMLVAYYLFAAAALTDLFDGYFARRSSRKVDYGATFDGIADLILVYGTIFALAAVGEAFGLLVAGLVCMALIVPIFGLISKRNGKLTMPHIDTELLAAFVYPTVMVYIIGWRYADVLLVVGFAVALWTATRYLVHIRAIYRTNVG